MRKGKDKEFYSAQSLFSKLGGAIEKLQYDFSDRFGEKGNAFTITSKIAPDDQAKQQRFMDTLLRMLKIFMSS